MKLSSHQHQHFLENGYLVFDQLFSNEQMQTLKHSALSIVDRFDPTSSRSIFSTNSADSNRDLYFLDSEDKVRCFFEEEAFDKDDNLVQDKTLSINKIGHALHRLIPEFNTFSTLPLIKSIATQLGIKQAQIRQSMYIFKQPRIGGLVRWHQDATYFFTTPQSVLTFWFAIEKQTYTMDAFKLPMD